MSAAQVDKLQGCYKGSKSPMAVGIDDRPKVWCQAWRRLVSLRIVEDIALYPQPPGKAVSGRGVLHELGKLV